MDSQIRYGLLTVSDRCSKGETLDKAGDGLFTYIGSEFKRSAIKLRKCVPDDVDEIKNTLIEWSDSGTVDVILTIGGTGLSPRDVTPEATREVITKEAPGLSFAMINESLAITPMAMLARPVCGVRGKTLIVNLPGSQKGSLENFRVVVSQLKHAIDLIQDNREPVNVMHVNMNIVPPKLLSKVDPIANIVDRDRKTPYPSVSVIAAQKMALNECDSWIVESTNLSGGLGHVIAQDVFSKEALPPFPAAIKDGYGVVVGSSPMSILKVIGDSTAGENPEKFVLTEGNCVRVSTGAPVPRGANAVVMIEDTELVKKTDDGREELLIRVAKQPLVGQDIRPIGSDININEKIIHKGSHLGPALLGILASVGITKFNIYKKPKVALLSTGNELQSPYECAEFGKVRDSNKVMLTALFAENGFETIDIGLAKDSPNEVLQKLNEGMQEADVLVSTGGVSMGEKDFLKQVLLVDLKAKIHFANLLIKPGKPTTFATCTFNGLKKFVFGLPGNPVSAIVTSLLFVIPACKKLAGWQNPSFNIIKTRIDEDMKLDKTRPEYHRVYFVWNSDSEIPVAKSTGNQISSKLQNCNSAMGLVILPQGTKDLSLVKAGSILDAIQISI